MSVRGDIHRFPMIQLVLVALTALLAAGASVAAAPASAAPSQPTIAWSPCYRDFGYPFECGTLQVPLDYRDPGRAAISLAVIRLPATNPSRRIGSLVLNPGGPGGSGVDFVLFAGPFLYTDEVRAHFDLVGFDPRGINRSTPLRCFGNDTQAAATAAPFAFPVTPADQAVWADADRALATACDQRAGRIRDHMSTADVARDLDLLRQAVGDAQLTYAGFSYGSYLGITYASLFPERIRAVVVDGVIDPIEWATGMGNEAATLPFSTRLRSDAGSQATLAEFFRLCDAGAANCAFAGDSSTRFAALAARLQASPIVVTTPDDATTPFTYADLIATALGAMTDSSSWPAFAQFLAVIDAAVPPTVVGLRLQVFWERLGFVTKRGFPQYQNAAEGFPSVACADTDNPRSYAAWSAATAAGQQYGYFGPLWTWISSVCVPWGGPGASRYAGPFTVQTANPVLVVGNLYDPVTRYAGAQALARRLPNARLLTVHGWGHTSLFLSQCADVAVSRYLITGMLPTAGTVCEQDSVPFAQPQVAQATTGTMLSPRGRVNGALVPDVVRRAVR